MLVDQHQGGEQFLLGAEEMDLSLRRHPFSEHPAKAYHRLLGELSQPLAVGRDVAAQGLAFAGLANRIRSSPSTMLAPMVWR